ncbi:MAG: PIN domain-containing protein [Acidobacteria bacterium]|nr:PIN domain-containing protein [Acidobacteriota bacterium]
MVFVDSNVPMYLVGAPHPNRDRIEDHLRAHAGEDYVTSAEVYQEIVHRYVAIDRRGAIDDAFRLLDETVIDVFPISRDDVEAARAIAHQQHALSARDCLHLAVMERRGVAVALTCHRRFALRPGIECVP